jgi:hypothetical protein
MSSFPENPITSAAKGMVGKSLRLTTILLWAAVLALVFAAGAWVTKNYYLAQSAKTEEDAQVLMERVKTVCKLVTVEGYFTEVYDYKDYWGYDLSFFRKKALIRVKAKVSVGFDLTSLTVSADSKTKTLRIGTLPEPSILSIDHELDYYDISEGTFNSFTTEDYNRMNTKAKAFIEEQAKKSTLFESAKKEGIQTIEMLRTMAEASGWKVETQERAGAAPGGG